MKFVWLLTTTLLLISSWLSAGVGGNDKELILVIEVTRHGARTPIGPEDTWLNKTWDLGIGQLTNTGERQQYLNGVKLRKIYIDETGFLPTTFNPKYIYVRSTDFNRTIMSALSQIQGLYPLEAGLSFTSSSEIEAAVPPFPIADSAADIVNSNDVLPSRPTLIPVHVEQRKYEFLLRGYDSLVCPVMKEYKEEGKEEADENSKKKLQPLYDELSLKFNVPKEKLNIADAEHYIDSYVMAKVDGKSFDNDLSISSQSLISIYYKYLFYNGIYAFEKAAKLTTSTFMQFLSSNVRSKIKAYNGDVSASEFHKNIRFILLSAHDTTVAGLISVVGLGNEQTEITPLASMLLIEVFKRNGSLFVSWNYNGQRLRLGNNWNAEGNFNNWAVS